MLNKVYCNFAKPNNGYLNNSIDLKIVNISEGKVEDKIENYLVARYSAKGRSNDDFNRDILPDLTGNGHDIILKNFGWSKNSGYNGTDISFKFLFPHAKLISPLSININDNGNWLEYYGTGTLTIPSYKIKVEGLREYEEFYVINITESLQEQILTVTKDGIYTVPAMKYVDAEYILYDYQGLFMDGSNVIITILTDYPDGLVFDGIDDLAKCINAIPMKTIIMKARILSTNDCIFFDQRKNGDPTYKFAGYNINNSIAYNGRNIGGSTYIDGVLNTTQTCAELRDKDIVIAMTNDGITDIVPFTIGGTVKGGYLSKMVVYDFIGYVELLTPEEIQSEILKI